MSHERTRTKRLALVAMLAVLAGLIGLPAPAASQSLDAMRREATRLEAEISRHGERLSHLTEEFNEARLERERLQGRLAATRRELETAEQRWSSLRGRVGERARQLYMRPAAWAYPFLDARSIGEVARAQVLAGTVFSNDTDLLLETERSRAQMEAVAEQLRELSGESADRERAVASRRSAAEQALREQRSLLAGVREDMGQLIEAERRRQLQEAERRAAAEAAARRATQQTTATAPRARPAGRAVPAPNAEQARPVRSTAGTAVQTARDQLGKPYRWGAGGPDEFDCSGLTKFAWAAAGVNLPHGSRAQFASLPKVAREDLQPGDLVFFGNPIHHVGIYEGGGVMINSPQTGDVVRRSSIYRRDYAGAARP